MLIGAGGVGGGDLFGHGVGADHHDGQAGEAGGANARSTVQCVGYTEFDGEKCGASGHNALYLSTRVALAPFGALLQR